MRAKTCRSRSARFKGEGFARAARAPEPGSSERPPDGVSKETS